MRGRPQSEGPSSNSGFSPLHHQYLFPNTGLAGRALCLEGIIWAAGLASLSTQSDDSRGSPCPPGPMKSSPQHFGSPTEEYTALALWILAYLVLTNACLRAGQSLWPARELSLCQFGTVYLLQPNWVRSSSHLPRNLSALSLPLPEPDLGTEKTCGSI